MPADGSEPYVRAVVVQGTVPRPRKPIAVLAHRLRPTQSPPPNADVRRRMDPLSVGFLHAMDDPAPCGADAESVQVRSASGEWRRRYPEPHDVRRAQIKSLLLCIWPATGH